MSAEVSQLRELFGKWEEWSESADKAEDGWQADFPEWRTLMAEAELAMRQSTISCEELQIIDSCWRISEEDEVLADYAKTHFSSVLAIIKRLVYSQSPEVRWQVYDTLSMGGKDAEMLLRQGLQDRDPYCRRRAILSLARLNVPDANEIAAQFHNDPDPYIRRAASELETGGDR